MGCWKIQPGGCARLQGLAWSSGSARQRRGGRQPGSGRLCWILPRLLEPQKILGSALRSSRPCHMAGASSRAPPRSALRWRSGSGESRGAFCSSDQDLSDQDPFSFSRIGTSIFLAPAAWTAPVISCLCFRTRQARRTNPGCKVNLAVHRGPGRGERGDPPPGEMRLAVWSGLQGISCGQRNSRPPEQNKEHPKESFATAILADQEK